MNAIQLLGAVELGLIFGFLAWAVYLSLRLLQFPDMTVDGSFPLGAAVAAVLITRGVNPWIATLCACCVGAFCGFVTAYLTTRWKILHLLSGILTMTALMSINLRIMGGPNIALFQESVIFTPLTSWMSNQTAVLLTLFAGGAVLCFMLHQFLISQIGLALRAVGINSRMAQAFGINTEQMVIGGIALANAFVALAGALFAQAQGFADVSMGSGILVEGLASVIIGEMLIPSRRLDLSLIRCIVGSIFYRLVIAFALNLDTLGLQASDLKLVTALIVGAAMVFPHMRPRIFSKSVFKEQKKL